MHFFKESFKWSFKVPIHFSKHEVVHWIICSLKYVVNCILLAFLGTQDTLLILWAGYEASAINYQPATL